nr:reverse transcriptase domain-containing protein [Tanacetum cinerariifolium]
MFNSIKGTIKTVLIKIGETISIKDLFINPLVFHPPAYQAPAYQAPAPQTQGVSKEEFSAYVKANDALMRNMQTQGQNMQNQLTNLTELLTKFVNSNSASTSSSGTLPSNTIANPKSELNSITTQSEATKDTVTPPKNESTEDVQPPVVHTKTPIIQISKPVAEPVIAPIFKDMSFKISFADALILMPKFSSTPKALIENKEKLSEMTRTPLNEHCSVVLLKKFPEKLGDPGKFLIPCDFPEMDECLALADLGARINLMPWSMWKKLSLPKLTPTCMTLELADRSISRPIGVAEDVYVKVGKFHFSADFDVVDFDADPRVPLILMRSFLKTEIALIDVFEGELTLRIGKEAITFYLDQTSRYSANYNDMTTNRIDVIDKACEEYSQEVLGFSDVIASGNPTPHYDLIVSTTSLTLTPFENSDFLLEEVDAFLALEDDPTTPKELKIREAKSDKSSIDEPPEVKLKDLPPHLEYVFMEGDDKLSVIIAKDLSMEEKTALITVLKSHKRAIAWKLPDIKGINPEFCTRKILMEDDFEPVVQHQRRVNPKIHDVIKNESHFMVKEGIVFGHKISKGGIEVDKAKVDVITKLPHPTTVKGIRSFLGHDGFYRRFIKDFSKIARPMTRLLKKDTPFYFSKECVEAFQTIKRKLTEGPILIAPDWDMPFELMCDASDFDIGAVLGQRQDKHFRIIHYASKTMTEAKSNYTTTEKEMLAVVYAFEKFWSYLIMNKSIVYLDHFVLKYLFAKKNSKARLLCWVLLLQEFAFKEKTKRLHDSKIKDHVFNIDDRVLLFNSRLKIFFGKLKSRWSGPFTISHVYPYGTVELAQPDGPNFKVNGHRLKHYFGEEIFPDLKTHAKGFCPSVFTSSASFGNHVNGNQEKDKIGSKPNKNGKRREAGKSQK